MIGYPPIIMFGIDIVNINISSQECFYDLILNKIINFEVQENVTLVAYEGTHLENRPIK